MNPTRDDVALFADFRNRGRLTARLDSATLTQSGAASRVQQALGSDWPRGPLNPMTMLQVAAANGRIGIADALTAYTAGSAALTIEQTLAPEGTARRFS